MEKLKQIDRRILIGVILLLCFLVIWLITTPSEGEKNNLKNILKQQTDEAELKYNSDVDTFNRALIMDNRYFCDQILNESMKADCKSKIVRYEPIKEIASDSEQNELDINSYNRALSLNKEKYCFEIQNQELQSECVNSLRQ